ncbi:hypothetical protein QKR09_gp3 [Fiwi virus]|uniref:Uncharacterized protein n=1 Tax=Fiwi virus TaxID=2675848 RepID=A0AAE6U9I1_9MONO|nr:hypothetical protein QKR09_gp3 [Fiwi virus]QGM12356.2 hypothetical protein [Fiwi virus]
MTEKSGVQAMADRIMGDKDLMILGALLDNFDDKSFDPKMVPPPPGCGDLNDISTFRDMFGTVTSSDLLNSLCQSSYRKGLESSVKQAGSTLSALMSKAPKDGNVNAFMMGYGKFCADTGTEHSILLGPEPAPKNPPPKVVPKQQQPQTPDTEKTSPPPKQPPPKPSPAQEDPKPKERPDPQAKPTGIALKGDPDDVASKHGGSDNPKAKPLSPIQEDVVVPAPQPPPGSPAPPAPKQSPGGASPKINFYQKILEGGHQTAQRYLDAVVMGARQVDGSPVEDMLEDVEKAADDPDEPALRVLLESSMRREVDLPSAVDYPQSGKVLFHRWARSGSIGATNYLMRRALGDFCEVLEKMVEESNERQDRRAAAEMDGQSLPTVLSMMMTKFDETLGAVKQENSELKRRVTELTSTVEHLAMTMSDLNAKLQTAVVSTSSYPRASDLASGLRQQGNKRSNDSWEAGATSWGRREGMIWTGSLDKDRLRDEGGFDAEESEDMLRQMESQWASEGDNPLGFGTSTRKKEEREEVAGALQGTSYSDRYKESDQKLRKYNF